MSDKVLYCQSCTVGMGRKDCPDCAERRMTPTAAEVGEAMARAAAADRRALGLIRDLFPAGSRVRWMHGDSVRSGTVRDSCGLSVGSLRFSVEGAFGRTYWIGAYRLLSLLGLESG